MKNYFLENNNSHFSQDETNDLYDKTAYYYLDSTSISSFFQETSITNIEQPRQNVANEEKKLQYHRKNYPSLTFPLMNGN